MMAINKGRITFDSMAVCSVMPNSLQYFVLQSARLLCPWDFPGRNIGAGCHFLLQGISLTQGSNMSLLWHYLLCHQGSPLNYWLIRKTSVFFICQIEMLNDNFPVCISFSWSWSLPLVQCHELPPIVLQVLCL